MQLLVDTAMADFADERKQHLSEIMRLHEEAQRLDKVCLTTSPPSLLSTCNSLVDTPLTTPRTTLALF